MTRFNTKYLLTGLAAVALMAGAYTGVQAKGHHSHHA